jgi:hypothetical protein
MGKASRKLAERYIADRHSLAPTTRQYAACGNYLSMGQLILELDQEAGIKQQHRVIGDAAALHLGLRRPSWH